MPKGQKSTDTREAPYSASQRCQHSPTEVTCEPSAFHAAESEPPEHQPASYNEQYDGNGDGGVAGGDGGDRLLHRAYAKSPSGASNHVPS